MQPGGEARGAAVGAAAGLAVPISVASRLSTKEPGQAAHRRSSTSGVRRELSACKSFHMDTCVYVLVYM